MAARAWPVGESLERDGWLLRDYAEGEAAPVEIRAPARRRRTPIPAAISVCRGPLPRAGRAAAEPGGAASRSVPPSTPRSPRGGGRPGARPTCSWPPSARSPRSTRRSWLEDGLPEGMAGGLGPGRGDGATRSRTVGSSTRAPAPAGSRVRAVRAGPVAGTGLCAVRGRLGGRLLPGHRGRGPPPRRRPGRAGRPRRLGRRARRLPPLPPGGGGQRRRPGAVRRSGVHPLPRLPLPLGALTTPVTGRPRSRAPRRSRSSVPAPPGGGPATTSRCSRRRGCAGSTSS